MGIEPTGRPVKDEPTRFEDGGGHQSRARFQIPGSTLTAGAAGSHMIPITGVPANRL